MRSFRSRFVLITSAAALVIGGAAWAAWAADAIQTDSADATSVIGVADAGTVTITLVDGALDLLDVSTAAGWTASVDSQTPAEIEIDFLTGGRRLRFNAQIEDGQIRTRVEERTALDVAAPAGSTTSTTGAVPSASPATAPGGETFDVLGAGTVTLRVEGATLVLVEATPAEGWTVSIDAQTALEVEIDFRSGSNRIRFNGQLEDGVIRPRIEVRQGRAPDTTQTGESSTATGTETFDIPGVGSLTVGASGTGLTLLTVTPSGEWTVEVEDADGERVRVEFHRGESEVEFEARWDDGRVRFHVDQDLHG